MVAPRCPSNPSLSTDSRRHLSVRRSVPGAALAPDPVPILYADGDYVVVNKPAGLLVHRSAIDRGETRFVLQMVRDQMGRRVYPVHRLDRPTSGALLLALSPEAASKMTAAFAQGCVRKTYLAIVRGFAPAQGVIHYPLVEQQDKMTDRLADRDKAPQTAITEFLRLATVELPHAVGRYATARYSLLRVHPQTGRKHQIRRHMKHIFHPVIGDTTHGDGRNNRCFREHLGCRRMLLAATDMAFIHPYTGQPVTITAPLDNVWQDVVRKLGWHELLETMRLPGQRDAFARGPDGFRGHSIEHRRTT